MGVGSRGFVCSFKKCESSIPCGFSVTSTGHILTPPVEKWSLLNERMFLRISGAEDAQYLPNHKEAAAGRTHHPLAGLGLTSSLHQDQDPGQGGGPRAGHLTTTSTRQRKLFIPTGQRPLPPLEAAGGLAGQVPFISRWHRRKNVAPVGAPGDPTHQIDQGRTAEALE